MDQQNHNTISTQNDKNSLSFIPLGGIGDVTRNMYLYEYGDQILIVDCGLGFADETMLGADLLLPDITYLLKTCLPAETAHKKIAGMVLSHGHEDHIGALPFVLPQLPDFPIYATPLTAALTNEKLKQFGITKTVESVPFEENREISIGDFRISFIRVTHSVPDSSNIFIKTPVGNFYHGSDFKLDLTPADGKKADFHKITRLSALGVRCLLSDCLGAERPGYTPSEISLTENFEKEMRKCQGKFIVTTYSSNISRLNQAIQTATKFKRRVCFIGRSLIKAKDVAYRLGYLDMYDGQEIQMEELRNYKDDSIMLLVAGSQGQENSAMTRIANGEHKDVHLSPDDVVIFSADPIPGNEVLVNSLIDTIARRGVRVVYSSHTGAFHVSGHGFSHDLMLMMSLVKAKKLLPIGGGFKQMVAYKNLANQLGYENDDTFLIEDGQEIIFLKDTPQPVFGKKIKINNVYVDQVSGEEIENYVLRDRQKLSTEGIVVVMLELEDSMLVELPAVIARGFSQKEVSIIQKTLTKALNTTFFKGIGQNTNNAYLRKRIAALGEQQLFRALRKRPLILPVIIEV